MEEAGYTLQLRLKNGGKVYFGPGPARLLEIVNETHSLNEAAQRLNMAYSKAWKLMKEAEAQLGYPLLERSIGGAGGGGSTLTDKAVALVRCYRSFEAELYRYADELYEDYFPE